MQQVSLPISDTMKALLTEFDLADGTDRAQAAAVVSVVQSVIDNALHGAFVVCGVGDGRVVGLLARAMMSLGNLRYIYVFDEGGEGDASARLKSSLKKVGFPEHLLRFEAGPLQKTVPHCNTLHLVGVFCDLQHLPSALECLWNRVTKGGSWVCMGDIDASWKVFQPAFATGRTMPLVHCLGKTCLTAMKLQESSDVELVRYDYIPPGFEVPDLKPLFPYAAQKNPWEVGWNYLRCEAPHIWRSDSRDDKPWATGNMSVEEAACLYTLAKQFSGKRGLEIGSHFGWTAAHLLAAGLTLDCIDPEFSVPPRKQLVSEALDKVETRGRYKLWGGFSPDLVDEVSESRSGQWSFALIDGSHDADHPRLDAIAVAPHMARNSIVVFHDLTSPFVERGLYAMRRAGFKTRLFNTMQILGIAWRGRVDIPAHVADPNTPRFLPDHLHKYEV